MEYFSNGSTFEPLNFLVQIDKTPLEHFRQPQAYARLPGAHESDQIDISVSHSRLLSALFVDVNWSKVQSPNSKVRGPGVKD